MKYYIGIDIGGTKIAISIADETCNIIDKVKFFTEVEFSDNFAMIISEIHKFQDKYQYKIEAIGISAGGPLDSEKGLFISPPHLPNWHNINIKKRIEDELHIPTFLENDANACALAEYFYGNGRGSSNFAFLTFGTGFGAGLILNGKLYRGSNSQAGEIGHMRISNDGPLCFEKRGCVESFCSGAGISLLHEELTGKRLTTKEIYDKAEIDKDKEAINTVNISSEKLGLTLSILIDILALDRIVIGSIYTRSKGIIEPVMMKKMNEEILEVNRGLCDIRTAYLEENIGDVAALTVAMQKGL
ncbi:MAG: ROK family protein [Sphaerochaetaceae bacterium]|nr:ROK family protein [Sphaerochaetaceae bacterium]